MRLEGRDRGRREMLPSQQHRQPLEDHRQRIASIYTAAPTHTGPCGRSINLHVKTLSSIFPKTQRLHHSFDFIRLISPPQFRPALPLPVCVPLSPCMCSEASAVFTPGLPKMQLFFTFATTPLCVKKAHAPRGLIK